jgi:hypothetical protein
MKDIGDEIAYKLNDVGNFINEAFDKLMGLRGWLIMCSSCGCGIDFGGIEALFSKDYKCLDCGRVFKGFGVKPVCQFCSSKNVKRAKWIQREISLIILRIHPAALIAFAVFQNKKLG